MNKNKVSITHIAVRFRDLDALGHVNNAVFFTYFEEGRKFFFLNNVKAAGPADFSFILAQIQCDYLKPVRLNDKLSLQLWVTKIGSKSFNLAYQLINRLNDSIVYAKGESVQVCFDYKQNKSIAVPGDLREKLAEYLKTDDKINR